MFSPSEESFGEVRKHVVSKRLQSRASRRQYIPSYGRVRQNENIEECRRQCFYQYMSPDGVE